MPTGPGAYDKICVDVLEQTGADCVVVIVLGGSAGSGYALNARDHEREVLVKVLSRMPGFLEEIAREIRADTSGTRVGKA